METAWRSAVGLEDKPVQASADVRLAAVRILAALVRDGKSLGESLPAAQSSLQARDAGLLQQLVFGVARAAVRLDAVLNELVKKPLRRKDSDVKVTLWLALFELMEMRTPDYAVVDSYTGLAAKLRKRWARSLINGTLRTFLREREPVTERVMSSSVGRYALPDWIEQLLRADWPEQAESIFEAGNRQAPLVLRVNQQKCSRADYLAALHSADVQAEPAEIGQQAIVIGSSRRITELPGFSDGHFSVQDSAAQLAAELLDPAPKARVLDACAAPGGKTCHLLERQPQVDLLALDQSASRLDLVSENMQRLGLNSNLQCADAGDTDSWWDGRAFDAILLDAPCSALGVLRRHPDIRLLRRHTDLQQLVDAQQRLLAALWLTLRVGGRLLYATCSVLKRENEEQIARFLALHDDAREQTIEAEWGLTRPHGRQILPGRHNADGFYYAMLQKCAAE